jgi:MFS family permease
VTRGPTRHPAAPGGGSLRSRPLVLLYAATFLFYLSFQVLLPVLPLYTTSLGGRESQIGLVIGVFAFAAMLLRPVAGELADRVGRYPLVVAGSLLFAAASAAYPTLGRTVTALLVVRFVHGMGMGLGPTAGTAMTADLAPPERRGAALGVYGMAGNASLAIGPYLGGELLERTGFGPVFALSATLGLASVLVATRLPETRPAEPARAPAGPPAAEARAATARLTEAGSATATGARATRASAATARLTEAPAATARLTGARAAVARLTGLFSAGALYPALLVLGLFVPYGALAAFLPLFAHQQRLGNPGLFFTAIALAAMAVRGGAGHLADRFGRRLVAAPALALVAAGLGLLAGAESAPRLLASAVLFGVGFGAAQPAILAMAADRVPPAERGRAMGTIFTAWELGILGGATLLGLVTDRFGYVATWLLAAAIAGLCALGAARRITRLRG